MATTPMRVPESVHQEVSSAARLIGCNAPELLERAWISYRQSPEFLDDFRTAQKALATGDLDLIAARLEESGLNRAKRRAIQVEALGSSS
jgi:hypothetical protein